MAGMSGSDAAAVEGCPALIVETFDVAAMINDVAAIAESQGVPKERIFYEKYNNL